MKANEAPEKIYVQLPSRNWIGRTWNETPIKDGDNPNWKNATNIEYIRKDAIIEQACEFISLNVTDYIDVTYKGGIEHLALQERFIDAFKKYIEGE